MWWRFWWEMLSLFFGVPTPGLCFKPHIQTRKPNTLMLGQESRRTKVSRIFWIFVPNFAPNFAPNFPRIFRGLFVLRFVGDEDQKKFSKNPRHFSMQNSQANTKKTFTKFFWRAGKVTKKNASRVSSRWQISFVAVNNVVTILVRNVKPILWCANFWALL